MKFLSESKSKFIYDDFFHDTILELDKNQAKVFKFQSVCTLATEATDDSSFSVVT